MERVGLIGLGSLGAAIAGRLVEVGVPLVVWNRTAERAKPLRARGAEVAAAPRALAERCDWVITVLADAAAVEAVLCGAEGVLAAERMPRALIESSTISASASERLVRMCAERGLPTLRAPVSGSVQLATRGALSLLVSGDEALLEACRPLLEKVATTIRYLGPGEEARHLKLVVNLMVAVTAQMMGEALALGEKAGLDWELMLDVLANSAVASPLVKYKQAMLAARDYAPAATTELLEKDLDLILESGRQLGVPLPTAGLARQMYAAASATGKRELDFFSLVLQAEEMAGLGRAGD
jgi:3-hydroxyisobutyrate dehydrogenase-like beta-hydroxyacid dehydrogenase